VPARLRVFLLERADVKKLPGISNADPIAAWKRVTDAVHSKGIFSFGQLCALGRTADAKVLA
jgi:NADPH2 dehydrogenase